MINNDKRIQFIVCAAYYTVIIAIIFLGIKYLLKPLLPFILAFIVSCISQKPVEFITSKTFLSKKWATTLFTIFLIIFLGFAIYGIIYALFREISVLSNNLTGEKAQEILINIQSIIQILFEKFSNLPFISSAEKSAESLFSYATESLSKLATGTLPHVLSGLMSFFKFFPGAVIFTTFMLISLFYIGFDYDKITSFLYFQLSDKTKSDFLEAKNTFTGTLRKIFKAYFLLTFITFTQLLCGFLILKIKYAFLLSLIICIVDLLPVLGTGTVLIPWSTICFLTGDFKRGIGLVVLYVVILVFRQIAEPKIIGANIGLSPLLSLISMYVGLKLFGVIGIIIFPILLITIISLNEKEIIHLYKNPHYSKTDIIQKSKLKFISFKHSDKQ